MTKDVMLQRNTASAVPDRAGAVKQGVKPSRETVRGTDLKEDVSEARRCIDQARAINIPDISTERLGDTKETCTIVVHT